MKFLQTEIGVFELRESDCCLQELDYHMTNALNIAKTLGIAETDICAKDNLDRCPVTSAIAGGQLYAAAGLLRAYAEDLQECRKASPKP